MHRDRKIKALRDSLGPEKIRKGDEYVFTCPRCQHRKPKLSVNLETDRFHCWVCGFKGQNLAPLLKGEAKAEYVAELRAKDPVKKEIVKQYDDVKLPDEFRTLTREWSGPYYTAAVNYLKKRGIGPAEILKWKIGYCEDGEYRYRIIIPSFDEYGHLNFFTGRTFYENPDTVNYKSGNFCKDIIWNDYTIDWEQPICLVEGPFDAFNAGPNAIALQGTILHDRLMTKIVASGVPVYVGLDADAKLKQVEIIQELLSYGVECYYIHMIGGKYGKKDAGEMGPDLFSRARLSASPIPDELCLLKYRVSVMN